MPLFEVIVRKDVEETYLVKADSVEDATQNWYEMGNKMDTDCYDETVERVTLLDDTGNPVEPSLPF